MQPGNMQYKALKYSVYDSEICSMRLLNIQYTFVSPVVHMKKETVPV